MKTYGPALGRVVASYARPSDQDDLAQDIAVALWNALPSFRGDCSERAFVFRVAHNRALVAKRDRIARDVLLAGDIERAVEKAGARVVSASGEGNGDSPADVFMRGLSLRVVAARLTDEGHGSRTGRQFLAEQVLRMLDRGRRMCRRKARTRAAGRNDRPVDRTADSPLT
jgi:hypothetical protein